MMNYFNCGQYAEMVALQKANLDSVPFETESFDSWQNFIVFEEFMVHKAA